MTAFKSDFLNILQERGFIHQCSDFDGLDAQSLRCIRRRGEASDRRGVLHALKRVVEHTQTTFDLWVQFVLIAVEIVIAGFQLWVR